MLAENRRLERNDDMIELIKQHFRVENTIDLSDYELKEMFLEGTGSLILDRENRIAYASLAPRTNANVITDFCERLDYKEVTFEAFDQRGVPVYHTNVVMALGEKLVVVCTDAIDQGKDEFLASLKNSGKGVLAITHEQMNCFAGNMLFVKNRLGERLVILSGSALASLDAGQKDLLSRENRMVVGHIPTIEKFGGGSVRSMLAEVFFVRN